MRYFKSSEFDCPGARGSGKKMNPGFLRMLDNARHYAGVPFKVNHGFRTREYYHKLIKKGYQAVKNSAHEIGQAADIAYNKDNFSKILNGFIKAGFKRVGIGRTFMHVDNDDSNRPSPAVWTYKSTPANLTALKNQIKEYIIKMSPEKKKSVSESLPSWEYL